jgi:DNA-binding IclR family transcriptional regulator
VIRAANRTGTSLPAHATAGGKALLAQLSPERLKSLMSGTRLAALTPKSITSMKALTDELDRIRGRGYAVNDGESEVGLRAVAVPVSGAHSLEAAITVSGPDSRMSAKRVTEVARIIRSHATVNGA